jgi:hypothetical protein
MTERKVKDVYFLGEGTSLLIDLTGLVNLTTYSSGPSLTIHNLALGDIERIIECLSAKRDELLLREEREAGDKEAELNRRFSPEAHDRYWESLPRWKIDQLSGISGGRRGR